MPSTKIAPQPKPDPDMPPSHIHVPEGPVECNCSEHLDRQDIQLNLPISAKRCYELLFSNEHNAPPTNGGVWFDKTLAIEGHDLSVTKWSMVDGKMQRVLKYWMPVANPIVRMKEAEVVETQVLITKEDYVRYTVQISTKTAALPYAEAFIPSVRYCITWVSKSECQLTCYLGVRWVKSVLVKSIVTRSALKGMSDSVGVFGPILNNAADTIQAHVDESRKEVIEYNSHLLNEKHETPSTVAENTADPVVTVAAVKAAVKPVQVKKQALTSVISKPDLTESPPPIAASPTPVVLPTTAAATAPPAMKQAPKSVAHHHHHTQEKQESWVDTLKTTVLDNVLNFAVIAAIGFFFYFSITWFISDVSLDRAVNNTMVSPYRRSAARSVYLRDLDEGFLRNSVQPPFSKSTR
jgi:hypothetical protein